MNESVTTGAYTLSSQRRTAVIDMDAATTMALRGPQFTKNGELTVRVCNLTFLFHESGVHFLNRL